MAPGVLAIVTRYLNVFFLLHVGALYSTSAEESANDLLSKITAAVCVVNSTEFYRSVRGSYTTLQDVQYPVPTGKS